MGPYPEPDKSSPHHPTQFPKDPSHILLLSSHLCLCTKKVNINQNT